MAAAAALEVEEYLSGGRRSFSVPLDLRGTPFQVKVWRAAASIPYGHVESYGSLAARVGVLGGARAVGRAMGANPVPLFVPCHRVVGADGSLIGFGGGLDLKRRLLEMEGVLHPGADRVPGGRQGGVGR